MLELASLIGTPETPIEVQTSKGRSILNGQSGEPDYYALHNYDLLIRKHPRWEHRKPACGIYNCAGHIWASRRTCIYDIEEINKILEDDGYRLLLPEEDTMPGDVVLYRDENLTDSYLHVAEVIQIREMGGRSIRPTVRAIWALSKWDHAKGEVMHHIDDVPFGNYIREIWTDRP